MNSHIQLPESILKQFRSQDGKVFYLDIESSKIRLSSAGSIGTKENYFSEEIETLLSKTVEAPMGRLRSSLHSVLDENTGSISIPVQAENDFRNYIIASIARSRIALETFYEMSFTAFAASDQQNHDDIVQSAMQDKSSFHELFKSWKMGVLVNESNLGFVVPRNCYYIAVSNGQSTFLAPVTPKIAIMLLKPIANSDSKRYVHSIVCSDDEKTIMQLNENALFQEYISNKCFIAGADKVELERLKQVLDSNRDFYEQQWVELRNT